MECCGTIIAKKCAFYTEALDRIIQSSSAINNSLREAIQELSLINLRDCLSLVKDTNSKLERKADN